jgi:hypothetical protein
MVSELRTIQLKVSDEHCIKVTSQIQSKRNSKILSTSGLATASPPAAATAARSQSHVNGL